MANSMLTRRAGLIQATVSGWAGGIDVVGTVTYNLGVNQKEVMVGHSGIQGYKEKPVIPFVEFEIRDSGDLDTKAFLDLFDVTVTLGLANGKTLVLYNAVQTGSGDGSTEEANIKIRFQGSKMDEI